MKRTILKGISGTLLACALAVFGTGCSSTTSSTKAHALKPTTGIGIDLSQYQVATVIPFKPADQKIDASVGAKFADGIAIRLQNDFGPIFKEVRKGQQPLANAQELIVTGTIKTYEPGSKFGRAMLIGVGAASFKGDLILKDGADNRVLFSAPFDKLWAWGGVLGMSKGIDDMVAESEATVASTVAQAKGWKPAADAPKSK